LINIPKDINWIEIILIIISIGQFIMLLRKSKSEVNKIVAETATEKADAVESYANATKIYSEELGKVSDKLRSMELKMIDLERIIVEQRSMIKSLTNWAQRLSNQVRSYDGIPVPFMIDNINTIEEIPEN